MITTNHTPARVRGFTLVELLAVIAIVGALAAIVISVVGKVRNSARRTEAASNIRQLIIGLQTYAADHKQILPPSRRPNGSVDETWRLRVLYDEGYIVEPKVFVNSINAADGARGLGQNVCGMNRDCYFSASHIISTTWNGANNVNTYSRLTGDIRIPVVWDQRADNQNSSANKMTTGDGRFGGFFGYIDGTVRLIGPPDSVIRGALTSEDFYGYVAP